jgi:hypothetical protein
VLKHINQFGQNRRRIGAPQVQHQGGEGRPSRHAAAGQGLPQQRPPGQVPQWTRQGLVGTEKIHQAVAEGHAVFEARGAGLKPAGQCQTQ